MDYIYDNGAMLIGNVYKVKDYICRNADDLYEIKDIMQNLEDLDDNDIVYINYDFGMGYMIEYWKEEDKVV